MISASSTSLSRSYVSLEANKLTLLSLRKTSGLSESGCCNDSTCASSDKNGLAGLASAGFVGVGIEELSPRTLAKVGSDNGPGMPCVSVSPVDRAERVRHLQVRELLVLWRSAPKTGLSAQYPSGNHTYSNPSRGGRGGSTAKEGGVGVELGRDVELLALDSLPKGIVSEKSHSEEHVDIDGVG